MAKRRGAWGGTRQLPSGRWQARYKFDGDDRSAPTTFGTRREAEAWLAATRADIERGQWVDPVAGEVTLKKYAAQWMRDRPDLRPRTAELYEGLRRLHILPTLGEIELGNLSTARIRSWHAALMGDGPGTSTTAKAYRLLRGILNVAVEDGILARNPCVIKGAGVERTAERPVATVAQVLDLAEEIEERFSALVLLAAFCGLRLGELLALTRRRIDLLHADVTVVEQYQQLKSGAVIIGPPKTDAGRRTVAIPPAIVPALEGHLASWAAPGPDGLLFPNPKGGPVRRASIYTAWNRACRKVGLEAFHVHDLRHTGNTLAASTGASTKELMSRMGHANPRAALMYQHATRSRDEAIADALSDMIAGTASTQPARAPIVPLGDLQSGADSPAPDAQQEGRATSAS